MRLPAFLLLVLLVAPLALAQGATLTAEDNGSGGGPGYRFAPNRLVVAPGATVALANTGTEPHTFTPVQKDAFADVTLQPGEHGSLTAPTTPGEYKFYCKFHASADADPATAMAGVLVVQAANATTTAAPATTTHADPGFEAVLLVAALGSGVLLLRRR